MTLKKLQIFGSAVKNLLKQNFQKGRTATPMQM